MVQPSEPVWIRRRSFSGKRCLPSRWLAFERSQPTKPVVVVRPSAGALGMQQRAINVLQTPAAPIVIRSLAALKDGR